MQKAARIKVQLGIGPEITTAIDILRAANEAMGLPAEGTLPAQADRLLAAIGISVSQEGPGYVRAAVQGSRGCRFYHE